MMIEVLKSKIHCARVTEANLNYMGSITIDEDLMDAANMIAGEKVYIADNNNGERFETYIIKGERGSGKICLNGAAARNGETERREEMAGIAVKNNLILYYGNIAGDVEDGKAVLDPMFKNEYLTRFLQEKKGLEPCWHYSRQYENGK